MELKTIIDNLEKELINSVKDPVRVMEKALETKEVDNTDTASLVLELVTTNNMYTIARIQQAFESIRKMSNL